MHVLWQPSAACPGGAVPPLRDLAARNATDYLPSGDSRRSLYPSFSADGDIIVELRAIARTPRQSRSNNKTSACSRLSGQ